MMKYLFIATLSVVLAYALATPFLVDDEEFEYNMLTDFAHFISHFGHEAISFLVCMGPTFVTHCFEPVTKCLVTHNILGCISAITCEGHDAVVCVHHLKNETAAAVKNGTAH